MFYRLGEQDEPEPRGHGFTTNREAANMKAKKKAGESLKNRAGLLQHTI